MSERDGASGQFPLDDARRFFWATTHFRRWVASAFPKVSEGYDISLQQLNVLYLVRTQDASMADIARILSVAPTVITGLVDRLEARGMLARQPDPTDRRKICLVLTDKGIQASVDIEARFVTLVEQSMTRLSDREHAELSRGLEILDRVIADLEAEESFRAPMDQ